MLKHNELPEIIEHANKLAKMFIEDGFTIVSKLKPNFGAELEIMKNNAIVRIWIDQNEEKNNKITYQAGFFDLKRSCTKPEVLLKQVNEIVKEELKLDTFKIIK
jgi:hypothetical protein